MDIFKDVNIDDYEDELIIRQLQKLKNIGTSALEEDKYNQLTSVRVKMSNTYNSAKICPYDNQNCATPSWTLDTEIEEKMAESRDYEELEYIWNEWRDKSGKLMKDDYLTYRDLMNEAATSSGYDNAGEMWICNPLVIQVYG